MQMESCGTIAVTDRAAIELTGILSVDSFDEFTITLNVSCGRLTIEGENLKIGVLDLEKGKVSAGGKINAVYYTDGAPVKDGFFSRILGRRS